MKHILCFSGGKDSMATAILAKEHNEPIDEIIYCEAMFDENRSAEYPEQVDFVYSVCKPTFKSWGVPFKILRPKKDFL